MTIALLLRTAAFVPSVRPAPPPRCRSRCPPPGRFSIADRLPLRVPHPVGEDASQHVDPAARRVRHDETDRLACLRPRPAPRRARAARQPDSRGSSAASATRVDPGAWTLHLSPRIGRSCKSLPHARAAAPVPRQPVKKSHTQAHAGPTRTSCPSRMSLPAPYGTLRFARSASSSASLSGSDQ